MRATDHPRYGTFLCMRRRCHNKNNKDYRYYGARGIKVCDEWMVRGKGFWNHMAHVSKLPHYGEAGYTLDRIDNDGNYEPGNVRWATKEQQTENREKSRTVWITHDDRTQSASKWAKEYGMCPNVFTQRVHRGWSVSRALTQPVVERKMEKTTRASPNK